MGQCEQLGKEPLTKFQDIKVFSTIPFTVTTLKKFKMGFLRTHQNTAFLKTKCLPKKP
jgi:hypothetical protein